MRHIMQNTWLRYKGENEEKYPEHLFAEVWKKKEGKIKYREGWKDFIVLSRNMDIERRQEKGSAMKVKMNAKL